MNDDRGVGAGLRVLLIGPTHRRGTTKTNVFGGMSMVMLEQERELAARGFRPETVDTSGAMTNLPAAVLALLAAFRSVRVIGQTAPRLRRNDVVCAIHLPERMFDFGVVLWLMCRLFRRPLVLRVAGGMLHTIYADAGRLRRLLADRTFMRADLVCVETRASLEALPARDNLRHLPNSRQTPESARRDRREARKLLFLSKIKTTKGMRESLQACRRLPEGCELSIYGAAHTGVDLAEIEQYPNATYRGVAEPADVPGILAEHDLMLLPTYHANEGQTGAIVEAFQAGLPVISTPVGGIPELVEPEVTGLLVEPRSVPDLEAAIRGLIEDPERYRRLCEGARRRGDDFRSDRLYDRFAADLSRVCGSEDGAAGAG